MCQILPLPTPSTAETITGNKNSGRGIPGCRAYDGIIVVGIAADAAVERGCPSRATLVSGADSNCKENVEGRPDGKLGQRIVDENPVGILGKLSRPPPFGQIPNQRIASGGSLEVNFDDDLDASVHVDAFSPLMGSCVHGDNVVCGIPPWQGKVELVLKGSWESRRMHPIRGDNWAAKYSSSARRSRPGPRAVEKR